MTAWLILLTMINHPAACNTVASDWILGTDLAHALPAFSGIPKDAKVTYAPAPGQQRQFLYPELKRIGMKYGIDVPQDTRTCFEWSRQPLTESAVRAAIRETLNMPRARVDVLAISRATIPEGRLEFPLSGLSAPNTDAATPVIWRGRVLFSGHKEFAVWARVRVAATMTRVIAVESLSPGKAIEKNQIRLESYDDFPLHVDVARDLDEVIGRTPRRLVRASLPVMRADLAEPFQVQRGEQVDVTVISGAAQVELEAVAQTSGRQGDMITLTNPRSGKQFRARVEGKDRALLVAGLRTAVQ